MYLYLHTYLHLLTVNYCCVQVYVEAGLRNVSGNVKWVQDGTEKPGSGPDGNIYITNMTTLVYPITATGQYSTSQIRQKLYKHILIMDESQGLLTLICFYSKLSNRSNKGSYMLFKSFIA